MEGLTCDAPGTKTHVQRHTATLYATSPWHLVTPALPPATFALFALHARTSICSFGASCRTGALRFVSMAWTHWPGRPAAEAKRFCWPQTPILLLRTLRVVWERRGPRLAGATVATVSSRTSFPVLSISMMPLCPFESECDPVHGPIYDPSFL